LCDLVNTALSFWDSEQQVDDSFCPVCTVAQKTQVTERLLGTTELELLLAQLVGELDEEFAVSVPLVLRECQDTSDVVILRRLLFLGEIPNNMTA
jgi:hypothetical protein